MNETTGTSMETLGTALPKEMARVRDKVLPHYDAIPGGIYAATVMRHNLDRATKALAEGDVVSMIEVYQSLKEFEPDMQ